MELLDAPARVRNLAKSIVAGATSDYERAVRLEQFLLANYAYDLRVSPFSRSGDVVDAFLFERRSGYCAQFATTMAVMARLVGLPARVATGYLPGEYNSLSGAHSVRLRDAHAWVEIKFQRYGWVPFDPTPRPDSPWALDVGYIKATRGLQQAMRSRLKDLVVDQPSSALRGIAGRLDGSNSARMAGTLIIGAVLIVGVGLAVARRRRGGTRRDRSADYALLQDGERELARKAYLRALNVLERKGYPQRPSHQGPVGFVASLRSQGLHVPEALETISRRAARVLYDPSPLQGNVAEEMKTHLKAVRALPKISP